MVRGDHGSYGWLCRDLRWRLHIWFIVGQKGVGKIKEIFALKTAGKESNFRGPLY